MAESQLSDLQNARVLLEEARSLSRNLAYHRRTRLEARIGEALDEVMGELVRPEVRALLIRQFGRFGVRHAPKKAAYSDLVELLLKRWFGRPIGPPAAHAPPGAKTMGAAKRSEA